MFIRRKSIIKRVFGRERDGLDRAQPRGPIGKSRLVVPPFGLG